MSRTYARPVAPGCCDHCGRNHYLAGMERVKVEPIREGAPDVGHLWLCESCRERPLRAWRLRWIPAAEAEAKRDREKAQRAADTARRDRQRRVTAAAELPGHRREREVNAWQSLVASVVDTAQV